ncbi:hypothetical protein NQ317_004177 [Molorchus minor]|uniref:Uncharacterized protein n=1 Tax=Molorchus minor TaxID=1323400 RepID=A0ABQ9J6X3_9CUCU|nr:hypothetical protein NQ317_004177 [Molorchus minor]
MVWWTVVMGVSAVLCGASGNSEVEKLDFTTVDVAKLATHAYGTGGYCFVSLCTSTYTLNCCFWKTLTRTKLPTDSRTSSGLDPGMEFPEDDDYPGSSEGSATIYKTKTIISTVFIESPHSSPNETESTTKCSHNCEESSTPDGQIDPSPTLAPVPTESSTSEIEEFFNADRQFWLLTVLKSDGRDPVIIDLKNSLAKLYKTAFQRQQARHLGINDRSKREVSDKPVNVHIHRLNKSKLNGDSKIEVLYHVAVAGKPIPAVTAAHDMSLVSDEEVRKEFGISIPYLKPAEPQSLSKAKNTWIFIGVSIIGFLIFLLIVAFLTLGLTKRKRVPTPINVSIDNRRHVFERGVQENKGFVGDDNHHRESPTYVNFRNENSTLTRSVGCQQQTGEFDKFNVLQLGHITPYGIKEEGPNPTQKPPRPKGRHQQTAPINLRRMPPEVFDSDSSCSRKNSPDNVFLQNYDPGVIESQIILSCPLSKSFPSEAFFIWICPPKKREIVTLNKAGIPKSLQRHGSVGAVEDPGVIGPIGVSVDEGIDDLKVGNNVSRMKKRFTNFWMIRLASLEADEQARS